MSEQSSPQSAALPSSGIRQVFVAYPYSIPKDDYRRPYNEVGKAFRVKFVFADERISDLHILEKIKGYIQESRFGIYDITGWNPNVALELGLALGMNATSYIAFDPSKTRTEDVPSDLRGMDRMQYDSFTSLEDRLGTLIGQELPLPRTHTAEDQLTKLRDEILRLLSGTDGLKIGDIAKALGVSNDLAKVALKPLLQQGAVTGTGNTRAVRYTTAH
ncbi:hypothetical protein JSY14_06255 [Brachybacterium sp. EF45031]|uniref:hypothetical protein n=1 Tax=Brachybacterium sillae TaxID=2810536 RepID=UPI00217D1C8F|nr:hypothetical protein [Brachybacterium sillae]MCS6711645.1 hypothetical protein [Brachybacterium sillae]